MSEPEAERCSETVCGIPGALRCRRQAGHDGYCSTDAEGPSRTTRIFHPGDTRRGLIAAIHMLVRHEGAADACNPCTLAIANAVASLEAVSGAGA